MYFKNVVFIILQVSVAGNEITEDSGIGVCIKTCMTSQGHALFDESGNSDCARMAFDNL